jgi:uncharacterized membrane protein YfcA
MILSTVVYLLTGGLAGLLAGLLGVGGGLVIVPALAFFFMHREFPPEMIMQMAIGTSLAAIVPTSVSSLCAHHRYGAVRWPVLAALAPGVVIGALLGAVLAHQISSHALRLVFGVFVLLAATRLAFGHAPAPHRELPGRIGLLTAGVPIGGFSALVGIGGGTLTVPYLLWHNVGVRQAVGTSAATGLPIALAGAAGFALTGYAQSALPVGSTGYLYWPAVVAISLASILLAPVGACLAHRIPRDALLKVFAVFLALVGLKMILA